MGFTGRLICEDRYMYTENKLSKAEEFFPLAVGV